MPCVNTSMLNAHEEKIAKEEKYLEAFNDEIKEHLENTEESIFMMRQIALKYESYDFTEEMIEAVKDLL